MVLARFDGRDYQQVVERLRENRAGQQLRLVRLGYSTRHVADVGTMRVFDQGPNSYFGSPKKIE